MDRALADWLAAHDGLVAVDRLPPEIPRWAVHNAVRSGGLTRILPGIYGVDGADMVLAAALYADGRAALSHTTALYAWGLLDSMAEPAHLTAPSGVRLRSTGRLHVHVRSGFKVEPPLVVPRSGLLLTRLEDALLEAWPLLPRSDGVGAILHAVNSRMTVPRRLTEALAARPRLAGRADIGSLLDKLTAGCRSHLELFGLDHVFTGPFDRQVPVRVGPHTYYLDVYAAAERVAFELDGASWHSSTAQRELDVRRDAALATLGILTVRYTYHRLTSEPAAVRAEVAAILAARRSAPDLPPLPDLSPW
ncbi:DUF559 domain-containing protein [Hamadaea sp. NPDC051192]|uniref:DUF559 domain-containing protein n=1 Tax=Hamadaea sp. NPDC051192 TaxID=3154940 RepID=UPI0034270DD5